jgi:hypothetical protein
MPPISLLWARNGTVTTTEAFLARYEELLAGVLDSPAIAGCCYARLTDTEQETNGLLTADRTPKLDPAAERDHGPVVEGGAGGDHHQHPGRGRGDRVRGAGADDAPSVRQIARSPLSRAGAWVRRKWSIVRHSVGHQPRHSPQRMQARSSITFAVGLTSDLTEVRTGGSVRP